MAGRWRTGRLDRIVSADVPAPPDVVRGFYVDLRNIARVHPLVVSVVDTGRRDGPHGYEQTYRVRDRIPLGPVAVVISYSARLTVPIHGDVHTEARQFPGIRLRGVVSFDAIVDGTRITERLSITAPRPLAALTARQAVAAHREMLAGIRRTFE